MKKFWGSWIKHTKKHPFLNALQFSKVDVPNEDGEGVLCVAVIRCALVRLRWTVINHVLYKVEVVVELG